MDSNIEKHDEKTNRLGDVNKELINFTWSIKLSHSFEIKAKPLRIPRFKHAIKFLRPGYRCYKFLKECKNNNVKSHIDFFSPIDCKQIYGVPIGGIGTGSIGRSFTGDFCRFQLVPGIYEHKLAEANMFTVNIRSKSRPSYQQSLVTRSSQLKGLKSWNLSYPGEYATYYALYPEAWTVYELPSQNVVLTCHQLSPIIPHNYKDSSLPIAMFNWTIENFNNEEIELALMLTWQSGSTSSKEFLIKNANSECFEDDIMTGVILNQKLKEMSLEYCLTVEKQENCEITYNCQFYPENSESGKQLWNDLLQNGKLDNKKFNKSSLKENCLERLAVALCATIKLNANEKKYIKFSLAWNMPEIYFSGDPNRKYKRFYTRFFSNTITEMAHYSFTNQNRWLNELNEWRNPILKNNSLPNFFKCCLFNELYFISDGGTIWIDLNKNEKCFNDIIKEYGRFAYLEGHEYRLYNTYDVHFYASFALVQLWPKLQLSMQYDFAEAINKEIKIKSPVLYNGTFGIEKTKYSMPHDLGDPENLPWVRLNAYKFHDTKNWKDLNLEFILSIYRDYFYLNDKEFLDTMWPYVKKILITVQQNDLDGDGLIESLGEPDQTYDTWPVKGASAYCGGLHVASLEVACRIAHLLNDQEFLNEYLIILKNAKKAYDTKLWNGKYYNYDSTNNSIMSDMCCGHWYLRSSGFNYEAFEEEKIKSCLNTIFEFNVMQYANGKQGAVNGMKPNGKIDISSFQSEEMWIGVTDSVAALMIYENMNETAWKTIEGLYDYCYNKMGLAFQMPEAICKSNSFRSLGYMRPLCIWAIQYAINKKS